ncbi:hypothetical protein CRG98_047983 [Punica granatum]|uniref:Non-specific lipid-transfer protein n=1 Tax=Punica granatum TaxID=22663 RepID=A0A2I0HIU2_PUNGR|nr:hypothetical protein CRG98_047983 [Punica granatum]
MASKRFLNNLVAALFLCMVVAAATVVESAVTCGQVTSSLTPCIPYTRGSGAAPSAACCSGIRSLNSAARTTPDRQTVCKCLKAVARSISGVNYGAVAAMPGKCGVTLPYKLSLSTDCNNEVK